MSEFIFRTANFDNYARVSTTMNNGGMALMFIDYHFIWTAESNGILTPEAQVYFNAAWERYHPGDCYDHTYAYLNLWTDFWVSQTDASDEPRAVAPSGRTSLYSRNAGST